MTTLRDTGVALKLSVSQSQVWRFVKTDGTFPRPFKLSPRITVWDEAAIDAWLENKKGAEIARN